MGQASKRMCWPPEVKSIQKLGTLQEISGRNSPRDVGISVQLGGHIYYVFGDTFCHDDNGQFVGVSNNSLAYVPNKREPTKTLYMSSKPKIPEFIPCTAEEGKFDNDHIAENRRFITWSFAGLIEDDPPECGKGWMWFEKVEGHGGAIVKGYGMRVCRVSITDGDAYTIKAERLPDEDRIFPEGYPEFGQNAVVRDDDWIYAIASIKDNQNAMARVRFGGDPTKHKNYQYWCKNGWQDQLNNKDDLAPVWPSLGQGRVMKLPGHGPNGKSFMALSCEKWPTGQIMCAWAEQMTGPWENHGLGEAPKHWPDKTNLRYAMFPHPWAYDWNNGELLVTYSDDGQMGGAVCAVKVTFAVVTPEEEEERNKRGHK